MFNISLGGFLTLVELSDSSVQWDFFWVVIGGSHIVETQQFCKVFEKGILKLSSLVMQ